MTERAPGAKLGEQDDTRNQRCFSNHQPRFPASRLESKAVALAFRLAYKAIMKITAGTKIYIGPPAKPIPKQISDAIGRALSKISEIVEAHLPMVYIRGQIAPPAQVLVLVLEENTPSPQTKIMEILGAVLPPNSHMDITEFHPGDPNVATVRATGTQLHLNRKVM